MWQSEETVKREKNVEVAQRLGEDKTGDWSLMSWPQIFRQK